MVSGTFFSGLGVRMARGRGFTAQDEVDHAAVMVISYDYWTTRFSRDPNVLGKVINLEGCAADDCGRVGGWASKAWSRGTRLTSGFRCRIARS